MSARIRNFGNIETGLPQSPERLILLEHVKGLSPQESETLSSCEAVISKHLAEFFQVGFALMTIQERRLYRGTHGSFEHYCKERWGFGRSQAYRLLDAAKVHKLLSPLDDIPQPDNERQIRPLTGLPPKAAEKAWRLAVEEAGNRRPTGRMVLKAVQKICRTTPNTNGANRENWQRLVIPLLKQALLSAKAGDQETLIGILEKASVTVDIGRCHRSERP